jgi:hypothetical protein
MEACFSQRCPCVAPTSRRDKCSCRHVSGSRASTASGCFRGANTNSCQTGKGGADHWAAERNSSSRGTFTLLISANRCFFGPFLRSHWWRREPRPQWVPIWSYGDSLRRINTFALPNASSGADLTPRRTWWRDSTNSLHSIRPTVKPRTRAGLELTVRGFGLPTKGPRIEGKSQTERLLPRGPFGAL